MGLVIRITPSHKESIGLLSVFDSKNNRFKSIYVPVSCDYCARVQFITAHIRCRWTV